MADLLDQDFFADCDHISVFDYSIPLCQPDDLLKTGAYLVFGPGFIVVSLVLLATMKSWLDFGRLSVRGSYAALRGIRDAGVAVRRRSSGNAVVASLMVTLVLAVQASWVFIAYYVGNSIRLFVEGLAGRVTLPSGLDVRLIPSLLQSDAYTNVAISLSAIAATTAWLARWDRIDRVIGWFSVPGYVWSFFGLAGGALNAVALALSRAANEPYGLDEWGVAYMLAFGLFGWFYIRATRAALRAPGWLRGYPVRI